MPAEWAPHARCWMAWPVHEELWGGHIEAARDAYADVANAIAAFEPVTMIATPEEVADASMRTSAKVNTIPMPHDDSWMRDNGPTFVIDGKGGVAGIDWMFNCWGEKFPRYDQDAAVAEQIVKRLEMQRFRAPLVLEGGSIHVDGEGTLITTESCLLNPNRNPKMSKEEIERHLMDFLNVEKILWIPGDPVEVETDGHVDNLACFVRPGVVMVMVPASDDKANASYLKENRARLAAATDAKGRPLEIIEMPQPERALKEYNGIEIFPSYVNFFIANGGIVMPSYEDPRDDEALSILRDAFPDRQVVQVPGLDIVRGGGCVHCITQQEPNGKPQD